MGNQHLSEPWELYFFLTGWLRQLLLQCLNDDPQCSGKVIRPFMGLAWSQPSKDQKYWVREAPKGTVICWVNTHGPVATILFLGAQRMCVTRGSGKKNGFTGLHKYYLLLSAGEVHGVYDTVLVGVHSPIGSFEGYLTLHPAITSKVVS